MSKHVLINMVMVRQVCNSYTFRVGACAEETREVKRRLTYYGHMYVRQHPELHLYFPLLKSVKYTI